MNIAFISFEYPPDTAYGGIATYVRQAVRMLHERGHRVEVFASSPNREGAAEEEGILVHRVAEPDRREFPQRIGPVFARRHAEARFDVLEGPEYFADARTAVELVPDIPLVVKLHTPSFLLWRISYGQDRWTVIRHAVGAFRRGTPPAGHPWSGLERGHALDADEVATPCRSLGDLVAAGWGLSPERVAHVPYPYTPSPALLAVPAGTRTNVVTFLGRLEIRKGVLDFARAIPAILARHPEARIRFVGRSVPERNGVQMRERLEHLLRPYQRSVEFTGPVGLDHIPGMLAETDVCVFPSLWENFPNVCLEAMSAARGIVGSRAGGMAEMLDGGRAGRLVSPHRPGEIARAVTELLDAPALRIQLGQEARERVLTEYNAERIGRLQEASYGRAIERRRTLGARHSRGLVAEMAA
ncbi:MAG: glycosyltransferase family 4 protein [Armatimonadetes bacterium]|nr:glycosyltransferase family 4 protein [Armatimonadota bacterium]